MDAQVGAERDIMEVVLRWAHSGAASAAELDAVLPYVRFPLMTPRHLQVSHVSSRHAVPGRAHSLAL